jgi:hypothetical protein
MNADVRELVEWAEQNGWEVKEDSKGYARFYDESGDYVANYPATPSNPYRRMKDLKTALKKAGLEIPPPSKKVQRSRRQKEAT